MLHFDTLQKSFHNILDSDESEELLDGLKHFEEVGEKAEKLGINVLVDAEYTSFNPAIRAITHIMMMKFNRNKPILQYTFQGYLIVSFYIFYTTKTQQDV